MQVKEEVHTLLHEKLYIFKTLTPWASLKFERAHCIGLDNEKYICLYIIHTSKAIKYCYAANVLILNSCDEHLYYMYLSYLDKRQ